MTDMALGLLTLLALHSRYRDESLQIRTGMVGKGYQNVRNKNYELLKMMGFSKSPSRLSEAERKPLAKTASSATLNA